MIQIAGGEAISLPFNAPARTRWEAVAAANALIEVVWWREKGTRGGKARAGIWTQNSGGGEYETQQLPNSPTWSKWSLLPSIQSLTLSA